MTKTISSLALLKVNWDKLKRDYVENFVPFLIALLGKKKYAKIEIDVVRKDFEEEFGLHIPYHPMVTILNRAKKRGYIQKLKNDKFIPVQEKIIEDNFAQIASEQENQYKKVMSEFIAFSESNYKEKLTENDADNIFIAFLRDHDYDMLFASQDDEQTLLPLPKVETSNAERFLVNSFVKFTHEKKRELFDFIVDISIGHIIANTLLQRDYENFKGKLTGNYYFDIGLLFSLIGINGKERKDAYKEFVDLLHTNKAKILIFQHTYDEFRGILDNCMKWVENDLFDPSRASRALMYFKENEFTASDIEMFILDLDEKIEQLQIAITDTPDPMKNVEYQIDEVELTKLIVKVYKENMPYFDELEKDYTITQDVKSISAVHKFRKGQKHVKLANAKYVFVTTNSSLAYASRQYEVKNSGVDFFFIPTCLTDVFLGTLIWLHAPSKIKVINERRLISNCYAALRPSKLLIKKFMNQVEKLKLEGAINAEEVVLLKESRVARNLLQEETLNDPNRFVDGTAYEILERAKHQMELEAKEQFENDRMEFKSKEQNYLSQLTQNQEQTNLLETDLRETRNKIEMLAFFISNLIFWTLIVGLLAIAIVTTVFQFNDQIFGNNKFVLYILYFATFLWVIVSAYTGFNIKGVGEKIRKYIYNKILQFFHK